MPTKKIIYKKRKQESEPSFIKCLFQEKQEKNETTSKLGSQGSRQLMLRDSNYIKTQTKTLLKCIGHLNTKRVQ